MRRGPTPPSIPAAKGDCVDADPAATAELTRLRVAPAHQGVGTGRALSDELERRAVADGYDHFVLDTGAENDRARGFYEARGFTHVDTETVPFGDVVLALAVYRKRL